MASTLVDLVKINITSDGTGPLTLGTAVAGYRGQEALTNGRDYSYSIQQGSNWEVGRGTYLSASSQIVRGILYSSNGGAAIKLSQNSQISFTLLAEDLDAVQLTADAQAAAVQTSSDASQVAADRAAVEAAQSFVAGAANTFVYGMAVYANAYATTLPQGLTGITIGGTAITGATVGTYALTPVGGSLTGVAANLVVDSATTAHIVITNPGLGTGTTPPTFANPAGATLPAGTTLTGVVGTLIPDQAKYWALSVDSSKVMLYGNNGGVVATAPFGGTQLVMYAKAAIDTAVAAYTADQAVLWPNDPLYGGVIQVNENNYVVAGVTPQGLVIGTTFETYVVWPNDPVYGSGPVVNESYYIIGGLPTVTQWGAYASAVLGDGKVWAVGGDLSVQLSAPVGTAYGAQIRNDVAYWVDGTSYRAFPFHGLDALPSTITKVTLIPGDGQSLMASFTAGTPAALTSTAAARTFMFNGGTVPIQDAKLAAQPTGLAPIDDRQFASLQPLVEKIRAVNGYSESIGGGLAGVLAAARPSTEAIVFASFAVGSTTISQHGSGSYPFQNMLRGIERVAAWCKLHGIAFDCPLMAWLQGEGDIAALTSPSTYSTALLNYQSAFKTAVDAIVGVTANRPILLMQPASASYYAVANGLSASMLDIAINNPTKVMAGGSLYHNPNYDPFGVHMQPLGYRQTGEEFGRAIAGVIAGTGTGVLYCTAIANSGTTLTITTNAATQLVNDTTTVTDPGQSGLVLRKLSDNSTVALSAIAVAGTNQITATLAGALTTGASYQLEVGQNLASVTPVNTVFAGPTSGYRACFRDSATDTYSSIGGGGAMRHWLTYQTLAFTAA